VTLRANVFLAEPLTSVVARQCLGEVLQNAIVVDDEAKGFSGHPSSSNAVTRGWPGEGRALQSPREVEDRVSRSREAG